MLQAIQEIACCPITFVGQAAGSNSDGQGQVAQEIGQGGELHLFLLHALSAQNAGEEFQGLFSLTLEGANAKAPSSQTDSQIAAARGDDDGRRTGWGQ